MVKFFMQGGKGTKVEKKPTDYRLIVYKEFMGVIKTKHLKYISRIVKSLKENAEMNQCEKEQKEGLLEGYKSIKKGEMKILSMYLMVKYLNITNFNVVEKFTKSTVPEVGQIVPWLSKPMTARSFGTVSLKSLAARSAPNAMMSLKQKTASGCSTTEKSLDAARRPPS